MKRIWSMLVVLSLITFTTCKKPTDNITITFNTASLFKAPLLVRFDNANPGSGKKPGDFKVTITGKDAALVQMGTGGSDFKSVQNTMSLALKSAAKPTEDNPLSFVINAEVAGFLPVNRTITMTKDSVSVFTIPLVEYTKPADGTARLDVETILNDGATKASLNFATVANSTLAEKVTISLPQETAVEDGSKKKLTTDFLQSTVYLYGRSTSSINSIMPNGLNLVNTLNASGALISGGMNFVTAGLLRINMFANRVVVRNFSKPLEVNQELAAGLINPITGQPLKLGETIPLWSLNTSGNWKPEGSATVVAGAAGKLVAKYNITYPTTWNLAWASAPNLSSTQSLNVNLIPPTSPWTGTYEVRMNTSTGTFLMTFRYQPATQFFQQASIVNGVTTYSTVSGKYGYGLVNVPNVPNAKIFVYNASGVKVGESAVFNPTTARDVSITVITPAPVVPTPPIEYVAITASFTGKCSNKNVVAPLNAWITINNITNNTSIYTYVKNGIIDNASNIKLIVGHQYNITSTYSGTSYTSGTFTMAKNNFPVPGASSTFTATTNYIQATNTVNITGTISLVCN